MASMAKQLSSESVKTSNHIKRWKHFSIGVLGLTYKAKGMKCLLYFGITSMKESTSAHLSGRGEPHGGG